MKAKDKTQYEELTDRQKSFVDAVALLRANNEKETIQAIQMNMEDSGEEAYSEYTIKKRKSIFKEIIDKRETYHINDRGVYEGDEHVDKAEDGRPQIDATMQHLTERPTKTPQQSKVFVNLNDDLLFNLIRTADEEVARELYDQIIKMDE